MAIEVRIDVFGGAYFMPAALTLEIFSKGKGSTLTVRSGPVGVTNPDPEAPSRMLEQLRTRLLEELPELSESVRQMVLRYALLQLTEGVEASRRVKLRWAS